jgi:hypothetical protein
MTLVSVLVAVALLGILAATLAAIFGNMSGLYVRSNVGSEVQNMTRLVQSVVNQPNLCDYSLRATAYAATAPNTPYLADWVWDTSVPANSLPGFRIPLDHIEINPGGTYSSQALVLHAGDTISPNLIIKNIYLRPSDPAMGEAASVVSKMKVKVGTPAVSKTFTTISAKLVLEYSVPGGTLGVAAGGSLKPGVVDVTLQLDPGNGYAFAGCYQGQTIQAVNVVCSSTNFKPPDCPAPTEPCSKMYYVSGFDDDGNAICRCQIVCDRGGFKKAPTVGPGPGPSAKPNSYTRRAPSIGPGPGAVPGPGPGPSVGGGTGGGGN